MSMGYVLPTMADTVIGTSGTISSGGTAGSNGGIYSSTPVFFISINNETLKNNASIDPSNSLNSAYIEQQYNNHYPVVYNNSIVFVPPQDAPPSSDTADYGYACFYNPSNGFGLDYHSGSYDPGSIEMLSSDTSSTLPLINNSSFTSDSLEQLAAYNNGEYVWQQFADQLTFSQCMEAWNYIFKDVVSGSGSGTINNNIVNLLEDNKNVQFDPEQKIDPNYSTDIVNTRREYLDLMCTLYKIAPPSCKANWASEIESFVSNSKPTNPVTIGIQAGAAMSVPSYFGSGLGYIPCIDYAEFMSCVMPAQDLHSPDFVLGSGDTYNTLNILQDAIDRSIAVETQDEMSVNRRTDNSDYTSDGWLYAYPAVIGNNRMMTSSSGGTWYYSSIQGVMQTLYFPDEESMIGMLIIGGDAQGSSQNNGKFEVSAKPTDPTQVTGSTIGQSVPVTVALQNTGTTETDLVQSISTADPSTLSISVKLSRDVSGSQLTGNSGNIAATLPLDGTKEPISPQDLANLISGADSLQYTDDTTNYPISPDSRIVFTYTAAVTITIGAETVQLVGDPASASVTFYEGDVDTSGNKIMYTSTPQDYSEIKQGSPGNESWEAMAGTPTDKSLYYASGGSEFIISMQVEYVPLATSTRQYTDIFNTVQAYGYMDPEVNASSTARQSQIDPDGYYLYTEGVYPQMVGSPPTWDGLYVHTGYPVLCSYPTQTWTQTFKYDYMKIDSLQVWKIDSASVNGMSSIIQAGDTVNTTIEKPTMDPSVFYNIAEDNTSADGRLRYTAYTTQNDSVQWVQDSNNDSYQDAYKQFDQQTDQGHKDETTTVTVVSDFVILQTTSGDQSALYYQETSPTLKLTDSYTFPTVGLSGLWTNNPLAAGQWSPTAINIGGYNGQFQNPANKFNPTGNGAQVSTIFDDPSMADGISRPARPTDHLMMYLAGLQPILTDPNGEYVTGNSTMQYVNVVNYGTNNSPYTVPDQDENSVYGPGSTKVNNIVFHDPVSSSYSVMISLDSSRDQRTTASKTAGGNILPTQTVSQLELPSDYRSNLLWNGDCETITDADMPSGWLASSGLKDPNVTYTIRSHDPDTIAGNNSFEIDSVTSPDNGVTNYTGYYYQDVNVTPNTNYSLTGLLNAVRCDGYVEVDQFDSSGNMTKLTSSSEVKNSGSPQSVSVSFKTPNNVNKIRIEIVKGDSDSGVTGDKDCLFADSLSLTNQDTAGFLEITNPIYDYVTVNGAIVVQPTNNTIPTAPPQSAYVETSVETYNPTSTVTSPSGTIYTPGNFINIDYPFSIYFPNIGDFYGNGAYGIANCSATEGMGFTNQMDTTEWTKKKYVLFPFNVVYDGETYLANQEIDLPLDQSNFNFYCVLANSEQLSANVKFIAIAINDPDGVDNTMPDNKVRYSNLAADQSAVKNVDIDVVGRIGDLAIEDTGDFRFEDFFKQQASPLTWLIPNVVWDVDDTKQNNYIADQSDIRGIPISSSTDYLDTYGTLPTFDAKPYDFPLMPSMNNVQALQDQPLRFGYNIYSDLQTIGNYYSDVQIIPYYYSLDLTTKELDPVDVYILADGQYQPINKFGLAQPGWDGTGVYEYLYDLDWQDEYLRRNDSTAEQAATTDVDSTYGMTSPSGNSYVFGDAQILYLADQNRTFIGSNETNGNLEDPSGIIPKSLFEKQAQRFNFTIGLPSSSVFVKEGEDVSTSNMNQIMDSNHVIVMALDIKAFGQTYALQYTHPSGNQPIVINGVSYPTTSIPYSVFAVLSANKSSSDDLSLSRTQ
jgi:hypothetical protein